MDRSHQWLRGSDATWNERDHRYTFPSGAVLQFGYLETARDKYRYQSAEFQYIAFDELTQFAMEDYLYLHTRARRGVAEDVPIRIRAASNPGGIGHEWVRQRFIPTTSSDPLTGEIRVHVPLDEEGYRRPFVPSRLDDNPHLDRAEYRKSLANVDPTLRSQMLDGDWSVTREGGLFKRGWFRIVDSAPKLVKRGVYVDLAATEEDGYNDPDWTSIHWGGMTAAGQLVIEGELHVRSTPARVEEAVVRLAERLAGRDLPGPYPWWFEQEPGSSGKGQVSTYQRRVLPGYTVRGDRPTGDKETRAGLLSSMAERGDVLLVRGPWIEGYLNELATFGTDDAAHDDRVDSSVGLARVLFRAAEAKSVSYIKPHRDILIRKGGLVLRGERYADKVPQ
jgi:predicted phage terminase large subunit-like protein